MKCGGGVTAQSSAVSCSNLGLLDIYPSTMLRMVPLPVLAHGED
jgi:hypothetical protein